VVGAHVRVLEDRRELVLGGGDLVVAGLDGNTQLEQLPLTFEHVRQHPLRDGAEVVVVQLVALRRLGPEEGAAGGQQVGPLVVEALVDQEVLLLGPHRGEHAPAGGVAEHLQGPQGRPVERLHGAQQRNLGVEGLAGPRRERRGDAQHRAVGVLEDERGAGGVPRRVATGLEGGPDAAVGEAAGVRLALDELLAPEVGQGRAVADGAVERVVLLRREPGERLEPVRVVGGPLLERPVLHRRRHGVGELRVEGRTLLDGGLQLTVDVLGQPLALGHRAEDVRGEVVGCTGRGEIVDADGAVGAPLGGDQGALSESGHIAEGPFRLVGASPDDTTLSQTAALWM